MQNFKDYILLWHKNNNNINPSNILYYLINLFQGLKKQGFLLSDLDNDIASTIVETLQIPTFNELYKIKWSNYLIYYIGHVSKKILTKNIILQKTDNTTDDTEKDGGDNFYINLNPDDLPDKQIDPNFIKEFEIEDVDG